MVSAPQPCPSVTSRSVRACPTSWKISEASFTPSSRTPSRLKRKTSRNPGPPSGYVAKLALSRKRGPDLFAESIDWAKIRSFGPKPPDASEKPIGGAAR
jgi:hypothetical protein